MSATKAYAMSVAGVDDAEYEVWLAQRRCAYIEAACALAARRVDGATLEAIVFAYYHAMGEAYERLAVARGYEHAHAMAHALY